MDSAGEARQGCLSGAQRESPDKRYGMVSLKPARGDTVFLPTASMSALAGLACQERVTEVMKELLSSLCVPPVRPKGAQREFSAAGT